MQTRFLLLAVLILLLLWSSHGDTTTVVLQNGLNGYNGCEDSYTTTEMPDDNFGSGNDLQLWNCVP